MKIISHDPFSISAGDIKKFGNTIVDDVFRNARACGLPSVKEDLMFWCYHNAGVCAHDQNNMISNIMDNFEEINEAVLDLVKFIFFDRRHYYANDLEGIDSAARVVKDFASILSSVGGFDIAWKGRARREHITRSMLGDAMHQYWHPNEKKQEEVPQSIPSTVEPWEKKEPLLTPIDDMFGPVFDNSQ
eukprot:CAMPEP_0170480656 /NCGR_PEP_ID=MMETSP0208-20121228/1415_1 /TAXON_ID=197538 /ORGANISM="Strombidium inclinatum, Strain S3" /LENGTH=187 /DNA_ID=CAMNT_0010753245 /DNA_START=337 /DNA_END=900 /DNA_ORIENTATION=+